MTRKLTREQAQKIIDAADAVMSALAGTNDEVHKDDTDKMIGLWDDLNDRYAPPEVVRNLASMALAAMDSEPVFFIEVEGDDWINAGRIDGRNRPDLGLLPDGINYLYAAPQPAPELSAIVDRLNDSGYEYEGGEVTPQNVAAVVDILLQQLDDAVQGQNTQPAPVVPDDGRADFEVWMLKRWGRERRDDDFAKAKFIYGEDYADSYTRCVWKAWSASRAAMLNGGKS